MNTNLATLIRYYKRELNALSSKMRANESKGTRNVEEENKLRDRIIALKHQMSEIARKFAISPAKFEKILSIHFDREYKLKVFREIKNRNGEKEYTGEFVICYLNKLNPFFEYEQGREQDFATNGDVYSEYALDPLKFADLKKSLVRTGSYTLSKSDEFDFVAVNPTRHLNYMNLLELYLGEPIDEFVSFDFTHLIKPILENRLAHIEVDEKLNVVNNKVINQI